MPCTWKTDLAMSRPMVVPVLRGCSCVVGGSKQLCYLTVGWEPSTASGADVLSPYNYTVLDALISLHALVLRLFHCRKPGAMAIAGVHRSGAAYRDPYRKASTNAEKAGDR
jgi:hypothetical protein